jgi:hypothetical protein
LLAIGVALVPVVNARVELIHVLLAASETFTYQS